MKVTIEELSPILKKVSVEVPAEDVDKALDRAYREANKSAKIPGFRSGKVPRRILERHYKPQVTMQVAEDLVRDSWLKAVEQEKLRAVGLPNVENIDMIESGKPFEFSAKVDVLPEPKVTDYEGLPGERPKVQVTSEDVDGELERIQQSFARLVPVEERTKVEEGDYILAEVSATADGEPLDTGAESGVTLQVAKGDISGGYIPEAEGYEIGDTVEVRHEFPVEGKVPEKVKGKAGVFKVTIKEMKRREVPPIDDELAKDLGEEGVDNLMALRGLIREKLTERRASEAERHLTDSLMKALVEKNPIDVPAPLVERAAASMVKPFMEQMARSGAAPGEFGSEEMLRRLAETSKPHAEAMLKGTLLLQAVADKTGIEVTDEDIDAHYEKLSKEMGAPKEKVRAKVQSDPEELDAMQRRVREEKALAHVKEKASIKEVDSSAAEETSEVGSEEAEAT